MILGPSPLHPAMEQNRVMKNSAKTSVPQFGGWDQKAIGATDYSMVFTQARANKKHQKTDLTEVKRGSVGNERDFAKTNHGHAHPAHGHHAHPAHGHHGHHARDLAKAKHGHTHPPQGSRAHRVPTHPVHAQPAHAQPHAQVRTPSQEDSVVMGKRRILTYLNCCIRP